MMPTIVVENRNMRTWIACVLAVFSLSTVQLADAGPVGTGKKKVTIPFAANTRDLHISVSGTITDVTVSTNPDEENTNRGNWAGGWNVAPGAGNQTVTVKRKGSGNWSFRYWLTTDGSGKIRDKPNRVPDGTFASLFPTYGPDGATITGENIWGTLPVNITDITATVVDGQGSFDDLDWFLMSGIDYLFSPTTLLAGVDSQSLVCQDCPSGSDFFPVGDDSWIKITANFDGVEQIAGYVPSPGGLALMSVGILLPFFRAPRRKPDARRLSRFGK
jgi:hypothetical protein